VIQLPTIAPDADRLERVASLALNADGTHYRRLYTEESEKDQRAAMERRLQGDLNNFTIESSSAKNTRAMDQNVVLEYSLTANGYAQPSGDLLLVRPRVVGEHARPYNDKPRTVPIDLGETGTWKDRIDVTLPAGYTVDDLPASVNLDLGFASYKSDVKADGDVLHYSREYVVRELDLPADKSGDVSKLMATINSDENSSAVLKKK
jgi:hypothetical protein